MRNMSSASDCINNKLILTGIQASDFIHPDDLAFQNDKGNNGTLLAKALSVLSDVSVGILRQVTEGRYVELSMATSPYIMQILCNTCAILDYAPVPRLLVTHERDTSTTVGGIDRAQILMPDYILEVYDEDMLYYTLGNAVTMLKNGHVRLATVCSTLIESPVTKPFELILDACMRAADLTSDRGGLLACQSYVAAAKCIMAEAGMPIHEMNGLNDSEIISIADEFMLGEDSVYSNWLSTIASAWKKLNWSTTPPFERLKELSDWYQNGYSAIIQKWGNRQ